MADPNWYVDSGATNHVTDDYNNIASPMEYTCTELVIIGNGEKLQISCTGNSCLTNGESKLSLENVLCIPKIAKNLISMSLLAQDNAIYFKFYSDCCFVKDKGTGRTLLKGTFRDGFYRLGNARVQSEDVSRNARGNNQLVHKNKDNTTFILSGREVSVNVVISKAICHRRLGHPSSRVLNSIVKDCNLFVKENEELAFCVSCQRGKYHALPFPVSQS